MRSISSSGSYLVDEVSEVAAVAADVAGTVLLVRVRETTHEPGHRHGALALCGGTQWARLLLS